MLIDFGYTEYRNMLIGLSPTELDTRVGGEDGVTGPGGTIWGVKIDDFSMFSSMRPDEFFTYMRDANGCYGIDQGSTRTSRIFGSNDDGTNQYYWIKDDYIYLTDYLQGTYGFSKRDSAEVLQLVDSIGACTYASTAAIIAYEYRDKPERFEECWGFPLYNEGAEENHYWLNGEQILVDLYVYANSVENGGYLFDSSDDGGMYIDENEEDNIVPDYYNMVDSFEEGTFYSVDKAEAFDQEYFANFNEDPSKPDYNYKLLEAYMSDRDPNVTVKGSTIHDYYYTQPDNLTVAQAYQPEFSEEETDSVLDKMDTALSNGESIVLGKGGLWSMQNDNGIFVNQSGLHSMYVTDANSDGFSVATWSGKYSFDRNTFNDYATTNILTVDFEFTD